MIIMKRKELNLVVLSFAAGSPLTPVQLQKSVFLIWKYYPNIIEAPNYNFQPYHYGPFDVDVYNDAELLAQQGLVQIINGQGLVRNLYTITPLGLEKAESVKLSLEPNIKDFIAKVVTWVRGLSFETLISSIYKQFPEYKVNSIFRS